MDQWLQILETLLFGQIFTCLSDLASGHSLPENVLLEATLRGHLTVPDEHVLQVQSCSSWCLLGRPLTLQDSLI